MGLLATGIPLSAGTGCGLFEKVSDPFEALLLLRQSLRQSADFLPARMAEAIASKDPEQMFAFVRDNIQTYPGRTPYTFPADTSRGYRTFNYCWGDAGCLRYGAGTFYEKAVLLKNMLTEAGFESSVKYGPFDVEKIGWERVFFYPHQLPFDADFPRSVDRSVFQIRQFDAVNPNDDRVEKILQSILNSLPDDFVFPDPDWKELTKFMDVVEVTIDGEQIILNPNIRDATFGEGYIGKPTRSSRKHERRSEVELELRLINTFNPYRPVSFVKAKFPLEKLFGNQICINFQNHLSTRRQLTLPRNRQQTFTPMISLSGINLPEADNQQYTFSGKSIHLNGDTLEMQGDELLVNDIPVIRGEEHPELRRKIRQLDLQVWGDGYPRIKARFEARDGTGQSVNGLEGVDFELLENGIPVPFQLQKQHTEGFKIFLLFDYSGSIPPTFREEEAAGFARKLMQQIQAPIPDAVFKACTFAGSRLVQAPGWAADSSDLTQQMEFIHGRSGFGSPIWTVLADASRETGARLGIFITDGQPYGERHIEEKKLIISRGCPIVTIGVGDDPNRDVLHEMAHISGGVSLSVTDHEPAVDFIAAFAGDIQDKPYALDFSSSATPNEKEQTLTLRVKDSSVAATATYTLPARKDLYAPSWIGIHLDIRYDGHLVSRNLAGMPTHSYNPEQNPVLPRYRQETEAAIFGDYRICFEGADPLSAALLHDLIDARLSRKPLMEAITQGTEAATIAALEAGFQTYPEEAFPMHHQWRTNSSEEAFTFQNGVRATLFSTYPNAEGTIIKAVDILPFSQWRTIHHDPRKGFKQSLRYSLQLMNLEALNYPKATLNLIPEASLDWMPPEKIHQWLREQENVPLVTKWGNALKQNTSFRSQIPLLPSDRGLSAFYNLDTDSGTVFAQLINGSGGGEQETRDRFAALDRALTVFDHVFKRLGVSPAVGAWIALEKKKMEYLMVATIAIITMDGPKTEEELNKVLKKHLCNKVEDATAGALGALGDHYKDLVDYVSIITGKSISVCG